MSDFVLAAKQGTDLFAIWSGNDGVPVTVGSGSEISALFLECGVSPQESGHLLALASRYGSSCPRRTGSWEDEMIVADHSQALLPRTSVGDYLRAWRAGQRDRCAALLDVPGAAPLDDAPDNADDLPERRDGPITLSGSNTVISLPATSVEVDLRVLAGFRRYGTINAIRPALLPGVSGLPRDAVLAPEIDLTTRNGLRLLLRNDDDPWFAGYEVWRVTTDEKDIPYDGTLHAEEADDVGYLALGGIDSEEFENVLDQLWTATSAAWRNAIAGVIPRIAVAFDRAAATA